jgi:hypothetical protein
MVAHYQSGSRDLNPRPPAPKAGALPSCATPRCYYRADSGIRTHDPFLTMEVLYL